MDLVACPGCRRHVRSTEGSCPFCASSVSKRFVDSAVARVSIAIGAAGFAASLNACYGAPRGGYGPRPPSEPTGTYVKDVDDADAALVQAEARAKEAGCTVERTENVVKVGCGFESFSISTATRKLVVSCLTKKGDECQQAYEKINPKQ